MKYNFDFLKTTSILYQEYRYIDRGEGNGSSRLNTYVAKSSSKSYYFATNC
jgi:hypothetical protein